MYVTLEFNKVLLYHLYFVSEASGAENIWVIKATYTAE